MFGKLYMAKELNIRLTGHDLRSVAHDTQTKSHSEHWKKVEKKLRYDLDKGIEPSKTLQVRSMVK